MKFNQIVILDYTGLQGFALDKLQALSIKPIRAFNDVPQTDNEKIRRIGEADCLFVSWNTAVSQSVLEHSKNLKYIGMCCSLIDEDSANVDVRYAQKQGIVVKGVRDYGDEGVTEFIVSELIQLLKGLGKHQWKPEPIELSQQKVGIVGMGTTGRMTAKCLQAFGAQVFYYSRNRKPLAENENMNYLPFDELLTTCDIVSFHLPRHTKVLQTHHFDLLGTNKVIVNTSLGLSFEKDTFKKWMLKSGNYSIFDIVGFGPHFAELSELDNLIYSNKTSGWTREAKRRLSHKVLDNVHEFLNTNKRF